MIKITRFRKAKRWSQEKLAEKVGISKTQVYLIEAGRYRPQPVTLLKIARALSADAGELLEPFDELE